MGEHRGKPTGAWSAKLLTVSAVAAGRGRGSGIGGQSFGELVATGTCREMSHRPGTVTEAGQGGQPDAPACQGRAGDLHRSRGSVFCHRTRMGYSGAGGVQVECLKGVNVTRSEDQVEHGDEQSGDRDGPAKRSSPPEQQQTCAGGEGQREPPEILP